MAQARKRVNHLEKIGLLRGLSPSRLKSIFTSLVRPVYEYGCAWTPITQSHIAAANEIERKCIQMPFKTKTMRTNNRVRAMVGLQDLRTRRTYLASRTYCRICLDTPPQGMDLHSTMERWDLMRVKLEIEQHYNK